MRRMNIPGGRFLTAVFCDADNAVACARVGHGIGVYDVATGELKLDLDTGKWPARGLAASHRGAVLAWTALVTASVYDVVQRVPLLSAQLEWPGSAAAFSADDTLLVIGCEKTAAYSISGPIPNTLVIFKLLCRETCEGDRDAPASPRYTIERMAVKESSYTDDVCALAFALDEEQVAIGGKETAVLAPTGDSFHYDGILRLVNVAENLGTLVERHTLGAPIRVAVDDHAGLIATAHGRTRSTKRDGRRVDVRDQPARLWTVDQLAAPERAAIGQEVTAVAFHPISQVLATGDSTGTVVLWHLNRANPICRITAHTGEVRHVAYSADGRKLLTVGADMVASIWDLPDAKMLDEGK